MQNMGADTDYGICALPCVSMNGNIIALCENGKYDTIFTCRNGREALDGGRERSI